MGIKLRYSLEGSRRTYRLSKTEKNPTFATWSAHPLKHLTSVTYPGIKGASKRRVAKASKKINESKIVAALSGFPFCPHRKNK